MNIYVFTSKAGSYNDGEYYFAAETIKEAALVAKKFQREHNRNHAKGKPAYKIKFSTDVKIFEVKPGYLPLNRSKGGHTLAFDLLRSWL